LAKNAAGLAKRLQVDKEATGLAEKGLAKKVAGR
jgi:hypothetical protein